MASIGERILELRKQFNLSQKELAEKTGITEASLSRYENNLREPKAEIITRISEVLECSTDYLLGRTNNKKDYTKSDTNLFNDNFKSKGYNEIEEKIRERLLNEGIIDKNEPITKDMLDKVLKYGIEATIEILKLEKKLEK
ncbi:helix-turn-helix domain-containing protein [Tissierella carlieri]|uniref:helix-turn-helix domain-containing protein n=1 Tax=Tissierella carlieri TaxID=689904 RepID=UPI001C10AA92|nr:helix-turn-helix transcriptional regulator [uncultured Tissierella sp.]MBU5313117.1 helix-turn-helix domain-containing protein [Tissierella carlieri]MDU5081405.1 helix-turn-helix transcriptional regulator [Bacillota bacterium]